VAGTTSNVPKTTRAPRPARPADDPPAEAVRKAPAKKVAPRARAAAKTSPAKAVTTPAEPTTPTAPAEPAKRATPAEPAKRATPAKRARKAAPPKPNAATPMPAETAPVTPVTKAEAAPATNAEAAPVTNAAAAPAPRAEATPATSAETASAVKASAKKTTPTPDQLLLDLWPRLRADPRNAPKLLADAAVETFGPQAAAWADRTRATYPAATPQALARLATARFTRAAAQRGLLSALSGTYAPIALVGTAAITHASLVLHVAAAYGLDPTDPERAAEILVLLPSYRSGAGWVALRLADRVLPGTSLISAVLGGWSAAETVATRAERRYGWYRSQSSQESGSSS
jgi:hypothetical protein